MDAKTRARFDNALALVVQKLGGSVGSKRVSPARCELLAVLLPLYGGDKVLGPGQLVPLWDVKNRYRTDTEFEIQGYFAVQDGSHYVTKTGTADISELDGLVELQECFDPSDLGQQRSLVRAKQSMLGEVGGLCIIRPDNLPLGMIPIQGRSGLGEA